jgi:hypothetical protein
MITIEAGPQTMSGSHAAIPSHSQRILPADRQGERSAQCWSASCPPSPYSRCRQKERPICLAFFMHSRTLWQERFIYRISVCPR